MIFTPLLEKVCLLHDYVINYNENEIIKNESHK